MLASVLPVAGLMLSNGLPPPFTHSPPMNSPKLRLCLSSQANAAASLSGAGPYSMVFRICATLLMAWAHGSGHRMAMRRGIAPADKMFELPLDIGEQAGGAQPEQVRLQPVI